MPKLTTVEKLYIAVCFFLPAIIVGRVFDSAGTGVIAFVVNQVLLIAIGVGVISKTSEGVHDRVLWVLPPVVGLGVIAAGLAIRFLASAAST